MVPCTPGLGIGGHSFLIALGRVEEHKLLTSKDFEDPTRTIRCTRGPRSFDHLEPGVPPLMLRPNKPADNPENA